MKLKRQVDTAKQNVSELKGQLTAVMKQLKDDWEYEDIDTAEKGIQRISKALSRVNEEISVGIDELEKKYEV